MSRKRYPDEFKMEAVKQVIDRGHSVADVAGRLGMTTHSRYAWIKKYGKANPGQAGKADLETENARLKADLRRMTEERDILKKAAVDSICQCNALVYNLYWHSKLPYFSRPLI